MIRDRRQRRRFNIRKKVVGTSERPRLVVIRSNMHVAAQLVDDSKDRVLTGVSSRTPALRDKKLKRMDASREVGKLIAVKAKGLKVGKVVFDRAGHRYHGRVKAVAEGAREGGLEF